MDLDSLFENSYVLTAQRRVKVGREEGRILCELIMLTPYKIDGRLSCDS